RAAVRRIAMTQAHPPGAGAATLPLPDAATLAAYAALTDGDLMVEINPHWFPMARAADFVPQELAPGTIPPAPRTVLELIALFLLPWATAFLSDVPAAELETLRAELAAYTGTHSVHSLAVALAPV